MKGTKILEKEKGITLIALVVTIVVLLIIAGISLNLILGNNGLITKAREAKEKTEQDAVNTDKAINSLVDEMEAILGNGGSQEGEGSTNTEVGGGDVTDPETPEEPTYKEYFTYIFDETTKTAKITGVKEEYSNLGYYNSSSENTSYVISIQDGENEITDIVIPSSVEYNGENYTVTEIGTKAFGIYTMEASDFEGPRYDFAKWTSVTIPVTITTIRDKAFYGCSELTSIEIPDSVTSIGDKAFYGCSGLTSILVDEDNTVYDSRENCNAIIEKSTSKLIVGSSSTVIPSDVTIIKSGAFNGTGLTNIIIPSSVTNIESNAFLNCSDLTNISVDEENSMYDSRENCNAIIEKSSNSLILGCKETIIPNGVTKIDADAFHGCSGLTSIEIPDSVTSIGSAAFSHCSNLESITIPTGVTSIAAYTFSSCRGLTSIGIPVSVTNIGWCGFIGCSRLTTVNYTGTEEQWKDITISAYGNNYLTNATKVYNYSK